MTVGWGIIGAGNHADSRMAPAIARAANARLVAVASRDQTRAEAFAAKHGGARGYGSFEALLADPEVEIVYVGSPNGLHADHTIMAARAGKHVFVDKPMATTAADCAAMIAACRQAGVRLAVGFNQRFQPAHRFVRETVQRGEIGRTVLIKIECAASLGGRLKEWWYDPELAGAGGLMATGTHAIDLVRWITGAEIAAVAALTDASEKSRGIDDVAAATLQLTDGTFVQLTCGRRLPWPANTIMLHGDRGRISMQGTLIYDIGGRVEINRGESTQITEFRPPRPGYDIFTAEIEQFSLAVREGEEPLGNGHDGMICTQIVEAIQESARTVRTVTLGDSSLG
ncbi:MAG: oxidoreductase [Dehalococcoidia bacterium]|nr:MAG: oxidoreductase [Dehalococcoidia bacterium]